MANRGRPRKTLEQKIEENKRIRPEKDLGRLDTFKQEGNPERPDGLTYNQEFVWKTLVSNLPDGTLGERDSSSMRELVRWYGVYDKLMEQVEADPTNDKKLNAAVKAWTQFSKIAESYGWTPRDRSSIKVPPQTTKKEDDPFSGGALMAG